MFALIDRDACFAGTLAELAFAADRSFMLSLPEEPENAPTLSLSGMNFGPLPMVNHQTRLLTRFCGDAAPLATIHAAVGDALDAERAVDETVAVLVEAVVADLGQETTAAAQGPPGTTRRGSALGFAGLVALEGRGARILVRAGAAAQEPPGLRGLTAG